jgi:hypothetical protein
MKISALLLLLFIVSCHTGTIVNNASPQAALPKETVDPQASKILFLFFEVEKDTAGKENIRLTDKRIVEGRVKREALGEVERIEGNYVISLLDDTGKSVKQIILENPLTPTLESFGEGIEDGISKHKMNYDKAEFSIRINYIPGITQIKIDKITRESSTEQLQIIKF